MDDEDEATDLGRRLLSDMELDEALSGTATRNKKCPFFFLSFMMTAGRPKISTDAEQRQPNEAGAADGASTLFNMYDEECFISVDQPLVSRTAMELKMVGATPGHPYPSPISIEDALSTKLGENFVQWKSE